jgi:hypothetical protein
VTASLRLLKDHGIRPRNIRFEDGPHKGYEARQFEDAFARYLHSEPLQRYNPHDKRENGESESATAAEALRIENDHNPAPGAECSGVADRDAQIGDSREARRLKGMSRGSGVKGDPYCEECGGNIVLKDDAWICNGCGRGARPYCSAS